MSDDQFTLLFWVLLFVAVELFVIGSLIYALVKGTSVWQVEWSKWKDNDQTMNDQARKEQTETIESKLDDILNEVQLTDKARLARERRRKERKTEDNAKVQEEGERAFKRQSVSWAKCIQDICTTDPFSPIC